MSEHFLERMTWPDVEAARERGVAAVLIPIGSTEQHGRHMPLDTEDCFIARELCRRAPELGEEQGVPLPVAPTLNVMRKPRLRWHSARGCSRPRLHGTLSTAALG